MKFIGFGGWVSYYYYIIACTLTKLLKEDIFGFGKSFQILNDLIIAKHKFLILFISYFSEFFFGLIISLYLMLNEKAHIRKKNKYEKTKDDVPSHIVEKKEKIHKSQKIIKNNINPNQIVELITKDEEKSNNNNDNDNGNDIELSSNEININLIDDDSNNNKSDKIEGNSGKKVNNKNNEISQNPQIVPKKVELIHNDAYDDVTEVSISAIILSSFLLIINDVVMKWIFSRNEIFDYFFLNILIMTLIFKYHYKEEIYSHQSVGLLIILFISGTLFVACLFEDIDLSNTNKTIWESFDEKHYMVFIFIIIYFASSTSSCYGTIIQKRIMDYQFVSPYNIIFYKGLLGMIISLVLILISTYIPCKKNHIVNLSIANINSINNNTFLFYKNFSENSNNTDNYTAPPLFECVVTYKNNTYFDNALAYIKDIKTLNVKKDKYLELFLSIPTYCVLHFITNILLIVVNKLLSPIHCLIVDSSYRLLHIPIQTLQNIHISNYTEGFFYEFIIQPLSTKILRVIAHFISLIGYGIYLEIIELKCCGLNKNIRKNIKKRAKFDGRAKEFFSTNTLSTSTLSNDIEDQEEDEGKRSTKSIKST